MDDFGFVEPDSWTCAFTWIGLLSDISKSEEGGADGEKFTEEKSCAVQSLLIRTKSDASWRKSVVDCREKDRSNREVKSKFQKECMIIWR